MISVSFLRVIRRKWNSVHDMSQISNIGPFQNFYFKSMLPFSNSSCKDQGKKKTKHKVQTASRHFEYYDLFWWHYKLASYQNISLSPSQDAKHRKSGLRKSLPRGFFHYQCLSSMLKNMREPEEETFATVSNKQLWCTRNLIKQTKRSVFF